MSDECERITTYLTGGGLFNPELANHDAVRDLLIDCRAAIAAAPAHPGVQWQCGPQANGFTQPDPKEAHND